MTTPAEDDDIKVIDGSTLWAAMMVSEAALQPSQEQFDELVAGIREVDSRYPPLGGQPDDDVDHGNPTDQPPAAPRKNVPTEGGEEVKMFGRWSYDPDEVGTVPEDPARCPFEFMPPETAETPSFQCPNPRGKGAGGWCKEAHEEAYRRFLERGI